MRLGEWLDAWLDDHVRVYVKDRTYLMYKYVVERYVSSQIGDCDIDSVDRAMLQKYLVSLADMSANGKPLSKNTLKMI